MCLRSVSLCYLDWNFNVPSIIFFMSLSPFFAVPCSIWHTSACTANRCSIHAVHYGQDVDIGAINAMDRFYLNLRPVKATRCTDLNTITSGDDIGSTQDGHPHPQPRSPWDLGYSYRIDVLKAADIYKKLSMVEEIDKYVITSYFTRTAPPAMLLYIVITQIICVTTHK